MRRALRGLATRALGVALAFALAGCAGVDVWRVTVDAGRAICGALGCGCAPGGVRPARPPVAVDLYPDGTVRPVYAP